MAESTICLHVFYLISRIFIKKDSDFVVNRALLLCFVIASLIIPVIKVSYFRQMPEPITPIALFQNFTDGTSEIQQQQPSDELKKTFTKAVTNSGYKETRPGLKKHVVSAKNILIVIYLIGILIAFALLIFNSVTVFLIAKKANVKNSNGVKILIVEEEIPSFTFMKSIVISKNDYNSHGSFLLTHELAHIRLNHFYDLILLEIVKLLFWFNPAIYFFIKDIKQIHEYQADKFTLQSGMDKVQYQLLMINKCVGAKRFAFANSFSQSQIKNRINMINKPKKQQSIGWKLFAFFAITASLIIFLSSCVKVTTETQGNTENVEIKGSWKLIKYNYTADTVLFLYPGTRIKYIGDNNFCWVNIGSPNNKVTDTVGGTFKFDGENYTEYIEFVGSGMSFEANNEQRFTVRFEDDKLFLAGELSGGQKIREVWERLTE